MTHEILDRPAHAVAAAVRAREVSAREVATAAIDRITAENARLGAFTDPTFERALREADAVDAAVGAGDAPPLAGVPFAVKNLFDIAGVVTRAGSLINRDNPPATADATVVTCMGNAGAVLLGALNMGEYAYDFTGENVHDGASRNPHDPTRMSGGSSGGSATAVAAGMVAASLGSDTNGSIRVPASFCGLFGLKPTLGRLSRAGSFPFCASLDHVGPLARTALDLALLFDALQGDDPRDPAQVTRPAIAAEREVRRGATGLRIAVAGGYFRERGAAEAFAAVDKVAAALGVDREVTLPEASRARSAAYVITTAESSALHLERLRTRAADFDPDVRYRLLLRRHGTRRLVDPGAAVPRLVPRSDARRLRNGRRHPGAGDAVLRACLRDEDDHPRRRRHAGASEHRHLHPADQLHRLAGGRGPGLARRCPPADRCAGDRAGLA